VLLYSDPSNASLANRCAPEAAVDDADDHARSMSLQAPSIAESESEAPVISPPKHGKLGGAPKASKAPPRSPRP
jgi:hypothetical protein